MTVQEFNFNLPVYEIFTTKGSIIALNFKGEIEAEQKFLENNPIEEYLGIGEVVPIELNEDGLDINFDAGCPKDRIIRNARGQFAGCRPAGGGGGGGATKVVEAPNTINSKTNIAQLRAIAQKEGIKIPDKPNLRQSWINAIENKVGDKYKGVRGKKKNAKSEEKPKDKKQITPFKSSTKRTEINKDLDSQWLKEHELMRDVINRNEFKQAVADNEDFLKTLSNPRLRDNAEATLRNNQKRLKEAEEEVKNNPYKDVTDTTRLGDNYGIGYRIATSKSGEKIGVYDDKGNLQATALYTNKTKTDITEDDVKPHIYIDYLATAPWNVNPNDTRNTKGGGTQAIVEAVKLSEKEGHEGRVRLFPLDDAKPFYKKLGFKAVDGDDGFFSYSDWELSPKDARTLLEKVGEK